MFENNMYKIPFKFPRANKLKFKMEQWVIFAKYIPADKVN